MLTIRKRIARPYLVLILAIPTAIFLLFNLIVLDYKGRQAQEDLSTIVEEVAETIDDENYKGMESLLKVQRGVASAELLVFNKNGNISKMIDLEESFVTEALAAQVYTLIDGLEQFEIGSFRYEWETYYVVQVGYRDRQQQDEVVYISKGLAIDEFVDTVNVVLLLVLVMITGIALFICSRVTNSIVKPIERLTAVVEAMKSDELTVIEDKSGSVELARLTHELNELNARVYQFDQAQKSFLHNASHELRTPLMSIQGYADGIALGVFPDAKETAVLISAQSQKMTELVDDLLTLARAENFDQHKPLEWIDLSECLETVLHRYHGYAVSQKVSVQTKSDAAVMAYGNQELFAACVGNVLSNAIRYANHQVTVTLTEQEEQVLLIIADDGGGVPNTDRIFERFSKGDDGNFGLGLSIAKTAIERMGGQITVHNDDGAVFELSLKRTQLP